MPFTAIPVEGETREEVEEERPPRPMSNPRRPMTNTPPQYRQGPARRMRLSEGMDMQSLLGSEIFTNIRHVVGVCVTILAVCLAYAGAYATVAGLVVTFDLPVSWTVADQPIPLGVLYWLVPLTIIGAELEGLAVVFTFDMKQWRGHALKVVSALTFGFISVYLSFVGVEHFVAGKTILDHIFESPVYQNHLLVYGDDTHNTAAIASVVFEIVPMPLLFIYGIPAVSHFMNKVR